VKPLIAIPIRNPSEITLGITLGITFLFFSVLASYRIDLHFFFLGNLSSMLDKQRSAFFLALGFTARGVLGITKG
jgi:hypothetical protein